MTLLLLAGILLTAVGLYLIIKRNLGSKQGTFKGWGFEVGGPVAFALVGVGVLLLVTGTVASSNGSTTMPPSPSTAPASQAPSIATPSTAPPSTILPAEIYNAFDLEVRPGFGYDLDIAPGKLPVGRQGVPTSSAEYRTFDLYRTKDVDQISGIEVNGRYNPMQAVDNTAMPTACRQLRGQAGGNVHLDTIDRQSKVCLITNDGRPALLAVLEKPIARQSPLQVRVTVLES